MGRRQRLATWFRSSLSLGGSRKYALDDTDFFQKDTLLPQNAPASEEAAEGDVEAEIFTVLLSRNESGLGLVFDSDNVLTKLPPGCAAEQHGGIHIGDRLLAVDGVELQPGDRIGALFPMHVTEFELQLERITSGEFAPTYSRLGPSKGELPTTTQQSAGAKPPKPPRMSHAERVATRKEQVGKFDPSRPAPVFQEVVWNEYCVLFPDGSSAPFNEEVRYTALTGYLRKKPVLADGKAEFALQHGMSQRGWARHYFHLSMKQLAWFDEDPQQAMERHRTARASHSMPTKAKEFAANYKVEHSAGKGVGSALLYAAPCRLFVSRLYRNEFALAFGGQQLLVLQAATGADAQDWVVALAACLFFSSPAFEAVLAECRRFFDAAHKTIEGRLSSIEALDLVRAMGRELRYSHVAAAATAVGAEGGWFGIREFTYLVRTVCADADPRSELLRAFRLLDTSAEEGASSSSAPQVDGYLPIEDLVTTMRHAGIADEHVLMVIRAAGADVGDDYIPYTRLADALYPAAATAAKRRRTLLAEVPDDSATEVEAELVAREKWERQRLQLLRNADAASPDVGGGLVAVRSTAPGGAAVYAPAGTARTLSFATATAPSAGGVPAGASAPLGVGPSVPALGGALYGLPRAASHELLVLGTTSDHEKLTPRRQEILRSINDAPMPATPRTIADRVLRARRASEVSKQKATPAMTARLSTGSTPGLPVDSPELT